jgi:UDP-N-acetylmuramoylalanine--D-glutamate ligase
MYLKTQKFLVAGMSRSGIAASLLLLKHGGTVYGYDDGDGVAVEKNFAELKAAGGIEVKGEELAKVKEECDVLVLSPGVPIDHPLPVWFKKAGKKIVGEMEMGALFLRSPAVAVTGTNGKTTTVGMIERVLKVGGKNAVACGNIGKPLCSIVEDLGYDDIPVIEVSSFQLESLSSLNAHVCIVLNVTEDHLNRHYNMENYVFLKEKLLRNSTESEYIVLNDDDEIVRNFAAKSKAKIVRFSLKGRADGAYEQDGVLYWKGEKIMPAEDLAASGAHNRANALACICAAKLFGVPNEKIAEGLSTFEGIRHRIEKVGVFRNITYINDSKATNVDAALKALDCVKGEIVLLLGGKDKGYEYEKLFTAIQNDKNVVRVVLYGENRMKLLKVALKIGYSSVTVSATFAEGVKTAARLAEEGQTVLLSPASSSFDEFGGYEERGDRFVALVQEYEGGQKQEKQEKQEKEEEKEEEEKEKHEITDTAEE